MSYPVCQETTVPVAVFAMEESTTVTKEQVDEHMANPLSYAGAYAPTKPFLHPAVVLQRSGTIALWVDVPEQGEALRSPNYRYLWAATRLCNSVFDGVAFYHAGEDTGDPRWVAVVNTADTQNISEGTEHYVSGTYTGHVDVQAADDLEAGPHHFGVTWSREDDGRFELWIDGALQRWKALKCGERIVWPDGTGSWLAIGHFPTGREGHFAEAAISGLAVFDKALSETEMKAWMEHTSPRTG